MPTIEWVVISTRNVLIAEARRSAAANFKSFNLPGAVVSERSVGGHRLRARLLLPRGVVPADEISVLALEAFGCACGHGDE